MDRIEIGEYILKVKINWISPNIYDKEFCISSYGPQEIEFKEHIEKQNQQKIREPNQHKFEKKIDIEIPPSPKKF